MENKFEGPALTFQLIITLWLSRQVVKTVLFYI